LEALDYARATRRYIKAEDEPEAHTKQRKKKGYHENEPS